MHLLVSAHHRSDSKRRRAAKLAANPASTGQVRYRSVTLVLSSRNVCPKPRRPLPLTRWPSRDPAAQPCAAGRQDRTRPSVMVLALLAVVVVLDQAAKWWAWRHVLWTSINSGGDVLVGHTIGAWYAHPVTGALLDLLDFALLSIAVSVLARRRAPAAVTVPGALMTVGWGSNLLDRLAAHYWTAPDSVRGVVDFNPHRRPLLQRRRPVHHRLHPPVPDHSRIPGRPRSPAAHHQDHTTARRQPGADVGADLGTDPRAGQRGRDRGRRPRRGQLRRRQRSRPHTPAQRDRHPPATPAIPPHACQPAPRLRDAHAPQRPLPGAKPGNALSVG